MFFKVLYAYRQMDGQTDMASLKGAPQESESLKQALQVIYK